MSETVGDFIVKRLHAWGVPISIAQGSFVKRLGAQRPHDAGVVEAKLAGYALIGKQAPAFVALPALPVTRDNLLDAGETVYPTDATDNIKSSLGQ